MTTEATSNYIDAGTKSDTRLQIGLSNLAPKKGASLAVERLASEGAHNIRIDAGVVRAELYFTTRETAELICERVVDGLPVAMLGFGVSTQIIGNGA